MGLIRGVARTAAIAGTATVVSNRVSRRQANKWAAQDEQQAAEQDQAAKAQAYDEQQAAAQQQAYAAPPPPPPRRLRTTCLINFRSLESSKHPEC